MSIQDFIKGNKLIISMCIVKKGFLYIAFNDTDHIKFSIYDISNKQVTSLPYTSPLIQSQYFKDAVCDGNYNTYMINHTTDTMTIFYYDGSPQSNIPVENPMSLYWIKNTVYCMNQPSIYMSQNLYYEVFTFSKFDLDTLTFIPVITNLSNFILGCSMDSFGNYYLCCFPKNGFSVVKKYSSTGILLNDNYLTFSSDCFLVNIIFDNLDDLYICVLEKGPIFTTRIEKYNPSGTFLETIFQHSYDVFYPNSYISMAVDSNNRLFYTNSNNVVQYIPPVSNIPISNICFLSTTPITTDQGIFFIKDINPEIHTIRNKRIIAITKTITADPYLIHFEKHSIAYNYPTKETVMTLRHKIYYDGKMVEAYKFLGKTKNIYKVKYTGEILYNILMETYNRVGVNNLICETLHPKNLIAKLYRSELHDKFKENIVIELNKATKNRDFNKYKKIVSYI